MMFKHIQINEVDSTNRYLKDLIANTDETEEGTVIFAKNQQAGKGQHGNSWESEPGKNLTISLLLKPNIFAGDMFLISKIVSLAITNCLEKIGISSSIKWPNDIYYNNHKLGGILIENQLIGSNIKHSIIGIGLNVNQTTFLSDAPNPISIKQITNETHNINQILNSILDELKQLYNNRFTHELIDNKYWEKLYRNSGWHNYKDSEKTFKAKITTIENDGQLILENEQGETLGYYFKEVEFLQ